MFSGPDMTYDLLSGELFRAPRVGIFLMARSIRTFFLVGTISGHSVGPRCVGRSAPMLSEGILSPPEHGLGSTKIKPPNPIQGVRGGIQPPRRLTRRGPAICDRIWYHDDSFWPISLFSSHFVCTTKRIVRRKRN